MKAEKEKGKEKRNENKKKEAPRRPIGPREAACRSLVRLEKEGRFSNIELDTVLRSAGFSSADRGLYTRLVYGVLERKLTLDYLIGNLAERPAESLDLPLRTLLRLGLCQLLFFDRIPESAAVNESVEIAKKLCPKGAGMVNAVLRRFLREGKRLRLPSGEEDPDLYLSVRYSVSPRLCGCLREDYGMEKAESILSAFCTPPPITLRVNTLRTGREELLSSLRAQGYAAEPTRYSSCGIKLPVAAVSELAPLREGLCFVQDEASQLCVAALGASPGDTALDLCACPGGKSFGIAMEMENKGRLYSFDLHENKLSLLRRGAETLGITILEAACRDARKPDPARCESADRLLCDLPCSGTGVLWKKPELRYREEESVSRLPALQLEILLASADCLRRGGEMVFSTCTLRKKENEDVLSSFLAVRPDFAPLPFTVGGLSAPDGRLTLFPDTHGTDGFFIAKLRRKK